MRIIPIIAILIASISTLSASELTYEEFVDSCKDPTRYGQQVPPTQIKLVCKNVFTGWQPVESGAVGLEEGRVITAELFSNKYTVSSESCDISTPELNVLCPKLREVTETAEIEVSLTCDQIVNDDRDQKELCQDYLDEAINENPDIVVVEPTGRIFNACAGTTQKP